MISENTLITMQQTVAIRSANADDLQKVIQHDARVTLIDKVNYWQDTNRQFIG